ncbi:MAG TPA: hypothetical protein VHZ96_27935 [Frankiaceae bacterium]|nr:hypothetical protein [Frankiaceae bacterium]
MTHPVPFGIPPAEEKPAATPRSAMVYDPELAPAPDPQGDRRVMRILAVLTVVLIAGLGLAIYVRSHASSTQKNTVNAFLGDVRDRQYTAAYARLCPGEQASLSATAFASSLQAAVRQGHGLNSFTFVSGRSSQLIKGGPASAPVAQADARLTNGQSTVITLVLGSSGGQQCVVSGERDLFK